MARGRIFTVTAAAAATTALSGCSTWPVVQPAAEPEPAVPSATAPAGPAQMPDQSSGAVPAEPGVAEPGLAETDEGNTLMPVSQLFTPDPVVKLCPRMTISNAPRADGELGIVGYRPFVMAEGSVPLAVMPTNGACFSSGFGQRRGRQHKGLDFQARPPSMVHAAAAGRILEAGYRDDYGFQVVIDHGAGVHTRYAHLQAFEPGVDVGADIPFGQPLGMMGNSASYSIPVHLHYEVLIGDYDTPKKSFGLQAVTIFRFPYIDDSALVSTDAVRQTPAG
ncbi:MAG: peptidoglycan DD-metalloendopeptidase family protein [Pseudomonadota bacterium]